MPPFARRFRRGAGLLVLAAAIALIAIVVVAIVLLERDDFPAGFTSLGVAIALTIGSGIVASIALPRSRALHQVMGANPDGVVFLARRQPYEINDLATFVGQSQELLDQLSDRWVVASIDRRGMSAWSVEPDSRELLIMPWEAIGYIDPVALDGEPRHGIAVDVKPFAAPLKVAVGYAAFGVLAPFGRRGTSDVIAASEAQRPLA
jgi:hypothetical protein